MGIFKQMKDMKATAAAAPDIIDQANQLAEQSSQLAAAAPAEGPDFEPIAGVSLDLYVEISKALAAYNYNLSKAAGVAASKGVAASDWSVAVEGGTPACCRTRAWGSGSTCCTRRPDMGFLRDIKTMNKQAKGVSKETDPGQAMQNGMARMQAFNGQLAQMNAALSAPPGDAIEASAQVLSTGASTGRFNNDPIVPIELMIFQPGGPPRPVSTSLVVPSTQLHRLATGATVPVKLGAVRSGRAGYRLVRAGLRAGTAAGRPLRRGRPAADVG